MSVSEYYSILLLVVGALVVGTLAALGAVTTYIRRIERDGALQPHLGLLRSMRWAAAGLLVFLTVGMFVVWQQSLTREQVAITEYRAQLMPSFSPDKIWEVPDAYLADTDKDAELIAYGRDLVARTEDYFGVNGLVKPASINGLNCQNCHLDAGSKAFGNNYFAVESTYPQMRARSGALETIPKRINDCFQRSLNGAPLDTNSREMRAMVAYMKWLGTGIPKGQKPKGVGLVEVPFLNRPADPALGEKVYVAKCASCHGTDGQGLPIPSSARDYPPLWGERSYNEAAGLFRMSRFAGYVKTNMPFGASYQNPQLTDEEAWDVAAYVNSQPRPKHPFLDSDWPKIEKKPYDHPFGPFADTFPETQHKYGPFGPIVAFYKK